MSLLNNIVQFIWYYFYKPVIKRKISLSGEPVLFQYHDYIKAQLKLAEVYGLKYVIAGDSNGENLATYSNMTQLGKGLNAVCANIAIGGTRADQWVEYIESDYWDELLPYLKDVTFIWNIGGNNILQGKMDVVQKSLERLRDNTPGSYNCLIPPLYWKPLEKINPNIHTEVQTVNFFIKGIWKNKAIDTHTPFSDPNDNPIPGALDDLVHFSDIADRKVRIPLIIEKINKTK